MPGLLSKERITAKPGFNRWFVPPASILIHLCIGSVYAWSIFNAPLMFRFGGAAMSSMDWSLRQTSFTFTLAIVFLGLSAAIAGKWLERVGPRKVGFVAACCWGGGFIVGGVGILLHQIWLLYLGYGVIGGCGLGLAYVSPVSTLIKWFPDRRGMATGMAIMGFGGGALLGAPLKDCLIKHFYKAPEYLGTAEVIPLVKKGSVDYFRDSSGTLQEVVVVTEKETGDMIVKGPAGVYLVGTGDTGAAQTFFILGILYFSVMTLAAFAYRIPAEGWRPAGWDPEKDRKTSGRMITKSHLHIDKVLRTPQFYLLWVVLCLNVAAGIGVLSVAKTMMNEMFKTAFPNIVDGAFTTTFVMMISVFNMAGRFFWSSASDYIGRKNTYSVFFILGIILYLSIPLCAYMIRVSPVAVWLVMFYASVMLIFSMYGGGFATIPAYLADIFGTRYVGAIHGRLLTAWSAAGVIGPMTITTLRENARLSAIHRLVEKIDPMVFQEKFGVAVSQIDALIKKNTISIEKLMEIAPAGTIDPTSSLYNTTMFLMAGLLGIALVANYLVKPVRQDLLGEQETQQS